MRANRVLTRPRGWALLAAGVVAVGVPLAGGTLVAGGTLGGLLQPPPTLTVKKVVTGVDPPGTTFTVSVQCVGADPAAAGSASTTATTAPVHAASNPVPVVITFDSQGDPTSSNSTFAVPTLGMTCTATETVTGGAQSVSYTCAVASGAGSTAGASEGAASFALPTTCPTQQSVSYGLTSATITVTNAFPPPPVVVSPQFTG